GPAGRETEFRQRHVPKRSLGTRGTPRSQTKFGNERKRRRKILRLTADPTPSPRQKPGHRLAAPPDPAVRPCAGRPHADNPTPASAAPARANPGDGPNKDQRNPSLTARLPGR